MLEVFTPRCYADIRCKLCTFQVVNTFLEMSSKHFSWKFFRKLQNVTQPSKLFKNLFTLTDVWSWHWSGQHVVERQFLVGNENSVEIQFSWKHQTETDSINATDSESSKNCVTSSEFNSIQQNVNSKATFCLSPVQFGKLVLLSLLPSSQLLVLPDVELSPWLVAQKLFQNFEGEKAWKKWSFYSQFNSPFSWPPVSKLVQRVEAAIRTSKRINLIKMAELDTLESIGMISPIKSLELRINDTRSFFN